MSNVKQFVTSFFKSNSISISTNQMGLFEKFLADERNRPAIDALIENGNKLMRKWRTEERINEIMQQPVRILNATVGKPYETKFDFKKFNWKEITAFEF